MKATINAGTGSRGRRTSNTSLMPNEPIAIGARNAVPPVTSSVSCMVAISAPGTPGSQPPRTPWMNSGSLTGS